MATEFLKLQNLVKAFAGNQVVKDVNLTFDKGEFISLLGPSGCGKTTILRMIAGFEKPTSGSILVEGKDISPLPPNQRKIGMVFQAYALFPHMDVARNVGYGLRQRKVSSDEEGRRVAEALSLVRLAGYERRRTWEMSGGQQQRVALARALAPKPRMLLLDEPLSALDAKIRGSLRQEIRAIQRDLGVTTIFVTHDQEEALSISDRIVVLSAGNVEQFGAPFEIYNQPATRFVATFVGQLNSLKAKVTNPQNGSVSIGGQQAVIPKLPPSAKAGDEITLTMRPEAVSLANGHARDILLDGTVAAVNFLGSVIRLRVDLGDGNASELDTFNDRRMPPPAFDEKVKITLSGSDVLVLGD
jgi:putative spermidine/putrescine transport system ATP-binding protein